MSFSMDLSIYCVFVLIAMAFGAFNASIGAIGLLIFFPSKSCFCVEFQRRSDVFRNQDLASVTSNDVGIMSLP